MTKLSNKLKPCLSSLITSLRAAAPTTPSTPIAILPSWAKNHKSWMPTETVQLSASLPSVLVYLKTYGWRCTLWNRHWIVRDPEYSSFKRLFIHLKSKIFFRLKEAVSLLLLTVHSAFTIFELRFPACSGISAILSNVTLPCPPLLLHFLHTLYSIWNSTCGVYLKRLSAWKPYTSVTNS